MALKVDLQTKHGLDLKGAVLVITALSDQSSNQYQYSVPQRPNPDGKYQPQVHNGPRRHGQFMVSIFANEEIVRAGEQAIGHLPGDHGQAAFNMEFKSDNGQLEEAYQRLKNLYPDAKEIDLSDVGLR